MPAPADVCTYAPAPSEPAVLPEMAPAASVKDAPMFTNAPPPLSAATFAASTAVGSVACALPPMTKMPPPLCADVFSRISLANVKLPFAVATATPPPPPFSPALLRCSVTPAAVWAVPETYRPPPFAPATLEDTLPACTSKPPACTPVAASASGSPVSPVPPPKAPSRPEPVNVGT